ncbi:unnamed protein product [Soboliphyme baturini]|uniref:Alpha-ketoglutarate-dependent dioxygenase alkB homolog 7, mitochondrial n=1 Tax=Soboliphyme baturini TaxID=241478 RepID=A0A183IPZ8_9BILA|nr:unnamed protein product [Soboliphyme baturini]
MNSETEELQLYEEVHPRLKVQRYEEEHWDNAIRQYREIEKRFWKEENQLVIDRLKATQFPVGAYHQPFVHVLDIARDGAVLPHIDSVRYCGSTISGISLLSDAVMRLVHAKDKQLMIDLYLKRRSVYTIT